MRRPRPLRALALLAMLAMPLAACGKGAKVVAHSGEPRRPATPATMLDVLKNDEQGRFTTLLTCVDLMKLSDTLKASGPLTIFAPTNDQLATLKVSCKSDDKPDAATTKRLTRVLQQHIVASDVALAPPKDYDPAKPPRGLVVVGTSVKVVDSLLTDSQLARLVIDGSAKTVQRLNSTDVVHLVGDEVRAPNGYIHYLDKAISPPDADAVAPSTTLPKPYE